MSTKDNKKVDGATSDDSEAELAKLTKGVDFVKTAREGSNKPIDEAKDKQVEKKEGDAKDEADKEPEIAMDAEYDYEKTPEEERLVQIFLAKREVRLAELQDLMRYLLDDCALKLYQCSKWQSAS